MLEALVEFNEVSSARTDLDQRSLTLVRNAAPVAATSSHLLHVGPSIDAGVTAPTKWLGSGEECGVLYGLFARYPILGIVSTPPRGRRCGKSVKERVDQSAHQ